MRILFDARVLCGPVRHGIARHARGLLTALADEPGGHTFVVLAGDREEIEPLAASGGFQTAVIRTQPYTVAEQLVLPALLARLKVQLYYSPTFLPPLVSPCPQAFTIHDLIHLDFAADYPASRRLAWRAIIGPRARRAHAVLTGSETVADQIARRLRVPVGRIEVIGHGLEESFRPRHEREVRAIRARLSLAGDYLIAVGNRRAHKNLAGAVRAFQRFATALEQAPSLVVVGQAQDLSAPGPGRVIQAQEIGDAELAALYTGARATIFASLAEGFGLPPLEALACGCPVVTSDLPVLREVLGPEAALYTPPGDEAALAQGLTQVLAETEAAQKRTQAGQAKAAGYTWAQAARRLRVVFDRLERD